MNSSSNLPLTVIRMAIFAAILAITGASAYAQSNTADQAVAKMYILGIAGSGTAAAGAADGSIEVVGINQVVTNPPPTGASNTPPSFSMTITKKIDRATPRLFLSAMSGETLAQVKIIWTKTNSSRFEEAGAQTITLKGVLVTMVRQRPADTANPEARFSDEYEDVTFSVGLNTQVEWEYAVNGRTMTYTGWDFARGFPK